MKKWLLKSRPIRLATRYPKASMSIIPMLISVELGVSMIIGYLAARFLAGHKEKATGRFPNLVFQFRNHKIHMHHWIVFSNVLVVTLIFHFFVITPYLFYGFLGGVVVQGVLYYDDWREIVVKGQV